MFTRIPWVKLNFHYFFIEVQLTYNVVLVSGVEQSNSVYVCVCVCVCIHTYILFYIIFHYGLLQETEYSSLCYIVRTCCSSILHIQFVSANPKLLFYPSPTPF